MTAVTEIQQQTRTRRHYENSRAITTGRSTRSRRIATGRIANDTGAYPGLRGSGLIRRTTGVKTVIEPHGKTEQEPAPRERPPLGPCIQDTAECKRVAIIFLIKKRFRSVPVLMRKVLSICDDFEILDAITDSAITCRTLADFDIMLRRSLSRFVRAKNLARETTPSTETEASYENSGRQT